MQDFVADMNFAPLNFFIFTVIRNSVDFGSARGRKSLAGPRFESGGEAIFTGFRLGSVAKSSPGEALFVASSSCGRAKT